jgi:hypothetical protein
MSLAPKLQQFLILLVVACCSLGCSRPDSRPNAVPVYPVEGKLFVAGKPAVGAEVSFHPSGDGAIVTARVHPDGRFVPSQSDGAVGLAEGEYTITAKWVESGADRFAGKHADLARPLSQVDVRQGINLIPPIQLP